MLVNNVGKVDCKHEVCRFDSLLGSGTTKRGVKLREWSILIVDFMCSL